MSQIIDSIRSSIAEKAGEAEAKMRQYFGRMGSFKYVFKNGVEAPFQPDIMNPGLSVFRTADPAQIAELDAETAAGHPHIFIKDGAEEIAVRDIDPVEAFKRHIIEEYEAKKAQMLADPNNDRGNYGGAALKPTSTTDLGALAGGPNVQSSVMKSVAVAGLAKKLA